MHDDDEILEYTTDPSLIHEKYENMVDLVIDGDMENNPSTIVDCTDGEINVIREGIGSIDVLTRILCHEGELASFVLILHH